MKETAVTIAGLHLDIVSHGAAAGYLFSDLDTLLAGFIAGRSKTAEAVCLVYFDHEQTYRQRFGSEPRPIGRDDSSWAKIVADRARKIFPNQADESCAAIGFLNGCLIFDERNCRGLIYIFYSEAALHVLATLWKLLFVFACLAMVKRNRLMVHGAGIKKNRGRGGYLFLGDSGAGKSTIAALSASDVVLSDDATVIEVAGGNVCNLHATPFTQAVWEQDRRKRWYLQQDKLNMILFIHQATKDHMQRRERRVAFMELLTGHLHCFDVMGELSKRQAFDLCHCICRSVPAGDLYFRKAPGFWEIVMEK